MPAVKTSIGSIQARRVWDPLFDPSLSSGLILDLCPDYSTTITFGTGTQLAQINDRSGTGNNFSQGTGALQPIRGTDSTFGGRNVLSFNGSSQYLFANAPMIGYSTTGQITVALVLNQTFGGTQMPLSSSGYVSTTGFSFYHGGTSPVAQSSRTSTYATASGSASTTNQTYRFINTYDVSSATSRTEIFRNGVSIGSATNVSGTPGTFTSAVWDLGAAAGGLYYSNIRVGRVLAWNRLLSGPEIASLDSGLKNFFSL